MDNLVTAVRVAQEAALESGLGNSSNAIELYKRAIAILHESYKNENDENMKRKIFNQMKIYLERAEAVKQDINSSSGAFNSLNAYITASNVNFLTRDAASNESNSREKASNEKILTRDAAIDDNASNEKNANNSPISSGSSKSQDKSSVRWSDVAGLGAAKEILEEAVMMPLKFPDIFTVKIRPWKSILLYGPPGTGKTMIAQACANECNMPFIAISAADIMSKWQGESEKFIKNLFKNAPSRCIIFIDEIDSICGERNETDNEASKRIKTELLIQMQDLFNSEKHAIVIAATNLPWTLDSAIRRRFEKRIYIPLPDLNTRKEILRLNLLDLQHNITSDDINYIAEATKGFNASDVGILVRTSVMQNLKACKESSHFKLLDNGNYTPCKQDDDNAIPMSFNSIPANKLSLPLINKSTLIMALNVVSSSVDPLTLDRYDQWTCQFGSS